MTAGPNETHGTGATALTLNFAACSDRGLVRGNNEDSAYAGPRLIALADGMGGHAAGEVASQFLINSLRPLDSPLIDSANHSEGQESLELLLATATDEGNQAIVAHVDEHPNLEGMGCTLTALLFRGDTYGLCHVGDSRGYLLRDGVLEQITKDDTFVQSLVDEGKLAAEDVSSHPQRSLILKALTGRPVEPTLIRGTARVGDRYMLCSDGLSDPVSFDTIREVLSTGTPEKAARKLVEMALRGGGPDNVTVVVADVVEFDATTNAPLDSSISLPNFPVLAGAVAGEDKEFPRPDTSASRAAAIKGLSTTPGSRGDSADTSQFNAQEGGSGALPNDDAEPGGGRKKGKTTALTSRRGLWITLSVLLVLLLGASAAGYVTYNRLKDNYFVAEEGSNLVVKNGTQSTVLGMSLSSHYKDVCLDENATMTLVDDANSANTATKGNGNRCHRFSTSDLNPAARGALSELPEASLDNVVKQLERLAQQTLPVCVTRVASDNSTDKNADKSTEKNNDQNGAKETDANAAQSTNKAEKTNSPEDLTTPGVSCREVK